MAKTSSGGGADARTRDTEEVEVTWVELGNPSPVQTRNEAGEDGETVTTREPIEHARVTRIDFGRDATLGEMFTNVTSPQGPWPTVSDADPSWVASNNPQLQFLLASHWKCEEGHPADLEDTHYTVNGPPGVDYTTGKGLEGDEMPSAMRADAAAGDDASAAEKEV